MSMNINMIMNMNMIMNINFLKSLLFIPILGYSYFYNDIHLVTGISGAIVYITYTYFYKLSINNNFFAMLITPINYIEPLNESHKLISYLISGIHSLFISIFATLYIYQIIGSYGLMQSFFISMSYYLADFIYIIDTTPKISNHNYYILLHHIIIIYYQILLFTQNGNIFEGYLLYYLSRAFIAEYSVIPLNYSWYLLHTKQDNSIKMIVSSLLTLVLYFITRVVNFTLVLYGVWYDGIIIFSLIGLPLISLNYYWFYKLICKAQSINKKMKTCK